MKKDKKVKIEICKAINKILIFSIQFLKRIQLNTIERFGTALIDNPDKYESLIPNENADKNKQYSKMLQIALETPKNNNIAITGTYGSGKSSFLRTFENKNKEWKYLHISLATFEDNNTLEDALKEKVTIENGGTEGEEKPEKEIQNDKLNQLLEKSILQQIFYKEKDKTIPFSRFKRISNIKKWSLLLHSFFIGILLIYTLSIFLPEKVHQFLMCDLNEQIVKFPFISWVMFFILGFYFYQTFQYLMKLQVSKFNIKSGEIEVNNKDKTSILNEHLDEILYFFEVTSYNVVVIEDLDRFSNTEIYIKLRELNTLINNSKDIGRRVVFVYAIKDDMFKDKERTKFFDFIIPIIPYINSSSSFVKIKEKFANENIDEEFLRNISLRIDDMRLLINVTNEYKIYKHKIGTEKLNYERLLAMIIYKNFYPSDFAKLHINKGNVYDIFNERTKFIKEEIEKNKSLQIEKSEEISELENEIVLEKQKSIEELRMVYILKIFEKVNAASIYFAQGQYSINNVKAITSNEVFNVLINSDSASQARGYSGISISVVEKEIHELKYKEREKLITEHPNEQLEQLKKDLESLKKEESEIKKYNVSQITKLENSKIFAKIEKEKLLQFLIREGHIREDYYDYISYFFPGSLTLKDKDFVLSVKDDNAQEFEYSLSKTKEIIRNLTSQEFELKAILNYDLLEYMLKHSDTSEKYRNFVSNLTDNSEKSKEFILSFVLITQEPKKFIEEIAAGWKKVWLYISLEAQLSEDKKDEYFKIFFENLSLENLKLLNIEDSMKDYLESKQQLSKLSSIDNKKFQELIKKLNVKYKNIENPNDNPPLFNFIYENRLYERNEQMINKVILFKDSSYLEEKLKTAHFTSIKDLNFEHLTAYIFDDLNLYIENVFLKIETNTKESEDAIKELLKNEDLSIENKQAIIKKEEAQTSDIAVVPKELWSELLQENKLMPTWDNVLHYYKEKNELDEYLLSFLNIDENYQKLSKNSMNNKEVFGNELLQSFSRKILKSNELSDDAYSYLIKSVIWQFGDLNMDSLSSTKVDIILVNKKISLNQTTINSLKKNSENKQITLIENFKNVFLEKYEELLLDESDYIGILESSNFTLEEKNVIIEKLDLSLLENKRLVEIIIGLYLNCDYKIPINLFDKLFEKSNFENALKILIKQIPEFTNDKISDYLNQFESPYINLTEKTRKHLRLENTELNMKILKALELKGYIKRVEEVKASDDKIKVIRKMK